MASSIPSCCSGFIPCRELAKIKQQRELAKGLAELGTKLDNAEATYTPWEQIKDAKQQLVDVQRQVGKQLGDAELQLAGQQVSRFGSKMHTEKKQQHRTSLKELSQSLQDLGSKLEVVETSWTPWSEINDAKEQLRQMKHFVGEQQTTGQQDIAHRQDDRLCGA